MTPARALELVHKLVRVAAPNSGASEAERANAALEVCRLIAEHNLMIGPPGKVRVGREHRRSSIYDVVIRVGEDLARAISEDPFVPWTATRDARCAEESCEEPIFRDDRVWRRVKNGKEEYVHADCWTR